MIQDRRFNGSIVGSSSLPEMAGRIRNSYIKGSIPSTSDASPEVQPKSAGAISGKRTSASTGSASKARSQSTLSMGDTNSVLSSGLRKPQKRVGSGATVDSSHSSLQTNLIQSVKKSLAKTKRQWDRTGFIHIIYVLVLLAYSFFGGALFKALDGHHADEIMSKHKYRCVEYRDTSWALLVDQCANRSFLECQNRTRDVLHELDNCLRTFPQLPFNHTTSNYWNSLIYAITVYTTIGYGNIVVLSTEGRVAMILYAMVGIPLFFAFLNDMGQWFHFSFLKIYDWIRRKWLNTRLYKFILDARRRRILKVSNSSSVAPCAPVVKPEGKLLFKDDPDQDGHDGLIFTFAVALLIFYLVVICGVFMLMVNGQWNFLQAFYFMFQSISLIGFGDEFPEDPNVVLINIIFIIIGIILLSMCFFILQEWIRGKTYRLSTQVRRSVRRWRHYRPVANGLLDRKRVKNTRFSVPFPHLGAGSTHTTTGGNDRWKKRTNRLNDNLTAGQRLAVVDDCSPGPGRRTVVAVLTYSDDEPPSPDVDQQNVVKRPISVRRDGVHSVDETLINEHKKDAPKFYIDLTDGAVGAEDALVMKPESLLGVRRQPERRHTFICLDQDDLSLDTRKRTFSWLRTSDEQDARRQEAKEKQMRQKQKHKRLSYCNRTARFGKFQWIRQTNEDDDTEEEEEIEDTELIVDHDTGTQDDQKSEISASSTTRDEFL